MDAFPSRGLGCVGVCGPGDGERDLVVVADHPSLLLFFLSWLVRCFSLFICRVPCPLMQLSRRASVLSHSSPSPSPPLPGFYSIQFTPSTSAHSLRAPIRSTAHAYQCHIYVLSIFPPPLFSLPRRIAHSRFTHSLPSAAL
jgi:hypothetical protein